MDALRSATHLLRYVLFWSAVFLLQRILFALHFAEELSNVAGQDLPLVLLNSLRLDLATVAYITLVSLPFYVLWRTARGATADVLRRVLIGTQVLLLFTFALIHSGELNVYPEWNHKLTVRVFTHLSSPMEVLRTAGTDNYVHFLFYLVVQMAVGIWLLRWFMSSPMRELAARPLSWGAATLQLFGLAGLAVLGARGGWQPIPISVNAATFSRSSMVNDLSINSAYFFFQSLDQYGNIDLEKYLSQTGSAVAAATVPELLLKGSAHGDLFLRDTRPNIVMLVLESWASDVISHTGLQTGTTPSFDQLIREGFYFDRFHAASGTSEIGNAALFGGYPALPQVSLSMSPEKSRKLASINQILQQVGYTSSYLFGGDLSYGNLGGYFIDHQFDRVQDEREFRNIKERGRLSVYDTDLLDRFHAEINGTPGPFFQVAFTGSTHAPYDLPSTWATHYTGEEAGILNTIRFADHAIHEFLIDCEKDPWYANTIFIFVADHGRTTPTNNNIFSPAFFRIPLLFWGPALKDEYRGRIHSRIGSQSDLAATLLRQMELPTEKFPWSRDLMAPDGPEFALYTSSLGYGWLDRDGDLFYQMIADRMEENTFPDSLLAAKLHLCRSYLRTLWEEYKAL